MEIKGSLLCSQQPFTSPYPKDKAIPIKAQTDL
jgi:hypothetical protein